jgi:ribonuclease VapC
VRFVADTSAIFAIMAEEPEGARFHELLLDGEALMSVASVVELGRVAMHRFGSEGVGEAKALIEEYGITVVEVDREQMEIALAAMVAFGKGRGAPPAVLNFADLFSYALAQALLLPLLFKGEEFAATDITPALPR